jgi:hypothetical protein
MKRLQKYLVHLQSCAVWATVPAACSCGLTQISDELGITSVDERELARVQALLRQPHMVFVFGSNRAGRHGAGAAKAALDKYGAVYGIGEGLRGRSYALPTKDENIRTLPLTEVVAHVETFLEFARHHSGIGFAVTRIGCGLAGFTDTQIAPLFKNAPSNCYLPEGWG